MDKFAVRIAGPMAKFHSVTSDTPLKYVSREKPTCVKKSVSHSKREERTATKIVYF